MVNAAKDSYPAAGFVVDLDAERAHDLIDQIDAYRPRITEAMQELNERGKEIGKSPVEWQIYGHVKVLQVYQEHGTIDRR